jgi:hypothetical protein
MNQRSPTDRARDVELVADAITSAVRLALPGIVRKEVELQLGMREPQSNRLQMGKASGAQRNQGDK